MKTVLVTGSSRGIGRGIALRFAREGYKVALNCVTNTNTMEQLVSEIQTFNPNVIGIQADVSKYEDAARMFAEIECVFGGVDILVNNAGISDIRLFNTTAPGDWRKTLDTNLGSVLNCSHLAIQHMIREKFGVVINISSIWGSVGASCEAVYSASKAAVNSFGTSLAKELGPCGIRVNSVACGVIATEMNDIFSEQEKTALREEIPLGRFGSPSDIADLVYFLCSHEAAFITGKVITSDGGMT